MKIAFRVDASPVLGSGHLMRSMALAEQLVERGHSVRFVTRQMPDALLQLTRGRGHAVDLLPDTLEWAPPVDGEWPAEVQARDAAMTRDVLAGEDWVVCDHYGLGATWEAEVGSAGRRLLAIDDLGRRHVSAALLDHNHYADPRARYPDFAGMALLGPHFALLRPAFAAARARMPLRQGKLERILVSMGGTDANDATSLAIDAIELAGLGGLDLDVVIGAGQPSRDRIAVRCAAQPGWRLHVQTEAMAELFAAADLVVGAGGTSTWERCALGVPTVALELADNQKAILSEGARAGFLYVPDTAGTAEQLAVHLRAVADNRGLRTHMSAVAASITDGGGAARVAERMEQ